MNEISDEFILALAEYLTIDTSTKSILLQTGNSDAQLWARIRDQSPITGYPTTEEAIHTLTQWLKP